MQDSDSLYFFVYLSVATEPMSDQQLVDLLAISRTKNEQQNLTGMLLYCKGVFLQILEGPEWAVRALVEKIRGDPRHKGVHVLMEGLLSSRAFSGFSMGFRNLSGVTAQEYPGYSEFLNDRANHIDFIRWPHKALRFLLSFRESTDRAA